VKKEKSWELIQNIGVFFTGCFPILPVFAKEGKKYRFKNDKPVKKMPKKFYRR